MGMEDQGTECHLPACPRPETISLTGGGDLSMEVVCAWVGHGLQGCSKPREEQLGPDQSLLRLVVSLASGDLYPVSTDLTFLQSKESQLWALNLVQILMLPSSTCDFGQLMLKAPSLSFHTSHFQLGTVPTHLPRQTLPRFGLPVWPKICLVMGGLNWIAFHLGRASLKHGATDTLCCKEKPPACRDETLCCRHCASEGWKERGEASHCGLS